MPPFAKGDSKMRNAECKFRTARWKLSGIAYARSAHPKPIMKRLTRILILFFLTTPLLPAADSPDPLKYGKWGFDLDGADTAAKPGDDFFRYANGKWLDKTQIPPDKPAYSLRLAMTDLTDKRLHEMMEALGTKPADQPASLEEKV